MNPMPQKTPPRSVNLPPQPPSVGYSPSVPISVYREVVAELQAAKTEMESIKTQNQQLTKQNQQLRQEIEKAVQSALNLRQFSNSIAPVKPVAPPRIDLTLDSEPVSFQIPVMPPRMLVEPEAEVIPPHLELKPLDDDKLVIEQDSQPRRKLKLEKESGIELNGWMLGAVILLIVVSAFGAGFLLVRPLLNPSAK
ncbi:hypothetical protein [Leptolyngbya sp. FACHB-17]|uniref:hypothetical protein n=1 Tax=unclassified Leptolyngbya TaxID=2650499 RepID=UPI001A7E1EB9|nr:hypothetical protein [Leptolyngbya sp. FACHB-17]